MQPVDSDLHKIVSIIAAESIISAARLHDVSRSLHRLGEDLKSCLREADVLKTTTNGEDGMAAAPALNQGSADPFTYPLWRSHD